MNNKSELQGAAPAGAFRRPTAVRRLLGRRWVLSPRRGETLLVMPNAANHLQGPMLATASITGFAGISHFTLRRRAHNVRPYGLFSVKPEISVVLRQHRTIPALRLKHCSGSCGTASALPKCSIMSGCGTRIVLRGQKPLALCDRCLCFGSLFPPLAALTFAASSIICAFGLASAAPRSPYRHLELCGIVLTLFSSLYTQKTQTRSFYTHAQRGRFLLPLPAAAKHPGISSLCNQ